MTRKSNHRLYSRKIYIYYAVIICCITRIQLLICISSAVHCQKCLCILIGAPDRRQTGSLCSHYINAISIVSSHGTNTWAYKLHYLIFYIAILKHCTNNSNGNILWTYSWIWLSIQINGNNARVCNIISIAKELLNQLSAAFAYSHGTKGSISGMRVRPQYHLAAASHSLAHILVNNCYMRWYKNSAIFFCCRKTKYMVILIDCSAYCTKGVVAIGENIRDRKLFHARCLGCLNNTYKGNIVAGHGIKLDTEIVHILSGIMGLHNIVGHSTLLCLFLCKCNTLFCCVCLCNQPVAI